LIRYKYPEEKHILIHYATEFDDQITLSIIEKGEAGNSSEAIHLSTFFWRMVDQTVIDSHDNKSVAGQTNLGDWCEDIMQTLRYYFIASGFLNEWDMESDKH
jgi:hypothetical protein